jgi:hypothetical protein
MRKDTKSETLTRSGQLVLTSLSRLITLSGQNMDPSLAATIIQLMKDYPVYIRTSEGRKNYAQMAQKIKDTAWHDVVFPEPISKENKIIKKAMDNIEEHYGKKKEGLELFVDHLFCVDL